MTVVNNGLGGSMAATVCSTPVSGPAVEERVTHDSLLLPGITHLIIYAGTNDIGGGCSGADIIAGMRSAINQAREFGVKVLISTITPRASYTEVQNVQREIVNSWVREGGDCSGECEFSLDFDAVVQDPGDPNRIDPALDSGDGIHPTGDGYRLIAASIPLEALLAPIVDAADPAPTFDPSASVVVPAPARTTEQPAPSMDEPPPDVTGARPATGGGATRLATVLLGLASLSAVPRRSRAGRRRSA